MQKEPPQTPMDALARRFLKPDRSRLAELRAMGREVQSVSALLTALGPLFGEEGPNQRWFRMSRTEGEATAPARVMLTSAGRREAVLDRPPTLPSAVLYLSDVPAMLEAERAAREFARRLWAIALPDQPPPTDVVWRISGMGSTPSSYGSFELRVLDQGPLAELLKKLGGLPYRGRPLEAEWSNAFRAIASVAMYQEDWDELCKKGLASGESPLEPFLRIWQTGLGVWAITQDCVSLFVPERNDAPVLAQEIKEAPEWTRQLAQRCQMPLVHASELKSYLDRGASPGDCLFTLAAHGSRCHELEQKVVMLLNAGAEAGRCDRYGENALASLMRRSEPDGRLFLKAGFPIDAADTRGRTALHHAAAQGKLALATSLLDCGATVDALDGEGMTPLHHALFHGQEALVRPLLDRGASPHKVTSDGRTAYHLAVAGIAAEPLVSIVARFRELKVQNTPDRYGWLPEGLLSDERRVKFPVPSEREGGLGAIRTSLVPEDLVLAIHQGEPHGWAVLGDWLQQEDDLRGHLIAMALAEENGKLPQGRTETELVRQRPALLAPFALAHPLGALLDTDTRTALSWRRGVLWALSLPSVLAPAQGPHRDLAPALPALLQNAATRLLYELTLEVRELATLPPLWPDRMLIRKLTLEVSSGEGGLWVPPQAFPKLKELHLRVPAAVVIELQHEGLQLLRIEHPYQPGAPWRLPLLELRTPALDTLQLVTSQAPRAQDRGWETLMELLTSPPPNLRSLELRPVSIDLFDALLSTQLLRQLQSLTLSSAQAPLLEEIALRSNHLAHIETLTIKLVGMQRAARLAAQMQLAVRLPRIELQGIEYRKEGKF